MKARSLTAISLSMVFLIGPGSRAHAGGFECSFTPNEFEVEIDPALLEVDGPIDPTDPAILALFTEPTVNISIVAQGFFGTTGFVDFTIVAGGKTYTTDDQLESPLISNDTQEIVFPTSIPWALMLPGAGQTLLDQSNTEFVSDFQNFAGWSSALRNANQYPISLTLAYAAEEGNPSSCSITFVYTLGERRGGSHWDIDLSHFLAKTESSLPDTL